MPADEWTRLMPAAECPPQSAKFISCGTLELAVFHLADPDRFVVTRNSCPHAGANLAAGEIQGNVVTCPWHQWAFDLDTGLCTLSQTAKLSTYACKAEGGHVWAKLTFPAARDADA